MIVNLPGPGCVAFFKNIFAEAAYGQDVYTGTGQAVPQPGTPGVHPGCWVNPSNPGVVTTYGGLGSFLAVATYGNTRNVRPGDVCCLVQNGRHTHLAIIASDDLAVLNSGQAVNRWYRWTHVVAMGQIPIGAGNGASWFRRGWAYQAFANSSLAGKGVYQQYVWQGFGAPAGTLVVPPIPTVRLTGSTPP